MDIYLGKLFGFDVKLTDVPEEMADDVGKQATAHLDELIEAYQNRTSGQIDLEK